MIIDSTCTTLTNSQKSLLAEQTLSLLRMASCHRRISRCRHLRILSRPWEVRLKVWWRQALWTWLVLSSIVQPLWASQSCRRRHKVISSYRLKPSMDRRTKEVPKIWWGMLQWICPASSSRQLASYPRIRLRVELWWWLRASLGICLMGWCPTLSLQKPCSSSSSTSSNNCRSSNSSSSCNSNSRWQDRRWCRGCLNNKMHNS